MEKSFIMVKPDGVQRGLVGEVVQRLANKGFKLVGAKLMNIPIDLAETHYGDHKDLPFFVAHVYVITSGHVFAIVWEGDYVISTSQLMIRETNPQDALPDSVIGEFAVSVAKNIIHG